MNLRKLIKLSCAALKIEDETSLSYIYGKVLDKPGNSHIKNSDVKWTGIFLQITKFFLFLINNSCLLKTKLNVTQVFFYAGTDNQIKALASTFAALTKIEVKCLAGLESNVMCKEVAYINDKIEIKFPPIVILATLIIFFIKAPKLHLKLRNSGNQIGIKKYFCNFCKSYIYIPYFIKLLEIIKPTFVIQSNDHNVENRCLRLVAEIMGIKTVYLQHASVSNLFPALSFDYAFLDGEDALEKYIECQQKNQLEKHNKSVSTNVTVFLSGQKKSFANLKSKNQIFRVGIGVNMMDEFHHLEILLKKLDEKGINCIVRTHPYQSNIFINKLKDYISQSNHVYFSNSKSTSLTNFFEKCNILIAGNTSLHLEAAIVSIPTYYHEFNKITLVDDYYGFVKSGLSTKLPERIEMMSTEEIINLSTSTAERTNAIKFFSHSFGTQWQNCEGELVAETLSRIINHLSISDIYTEHNISSIFKFVYKIAQKNN